MRTDRSLTTILVLIAILVGATTHAGEKQPSETRSASCVVRITADPAIIPLNERTIINLLSSSSVGRDLIRQSVGTEVAGDLTDFIEIEWLSGTLQMAGTTTSGPNPKFETPQRTFRSQLGPVGLGRRSEDRTTGGVRGGVVRGGTGGTGGFGMGGGMTSEDSRGANTGGMGGMGTGSMGGGMMGGMGTGSMGGGMMGGMGTGSMGGGMMGGMGMGSTGGGMMGGMGTGSMGGVGAEARSSGSMQQCVTFGLYVNLPATAKGLAEDVLAELVRNLDQSLRHTCELYQGQLHEAATQAERRRLYAQEQLDELTAGRVSDNPQIQEQLGTVVDMSMLEREMSFIDAMEVLKNSVAPPLPITVLWNELADSADIDPFSPIGMDGPPQAKLESALKTLLKAVGGGFSELCYRIDEDVILVSTVGAFDANLTMVSDVPDEVDLRDLVERRRDLAGDIRKHEMRIATSQAREQAIQIQITEMRRDAAQKLKEDSVTQEMNRLVDLSEATLHNMEDQVRAGRLPQTALTEAQQKIAQAKIDLARRREELGLSAGGRRLSSLSENLSELAIEMVESKATLEILRRQLAEVDRQLAQARVSDPRAGQIRTAQQILAMAEQRVLELNRRLTNLQAPIVTTIGAN